MERYRERRSPERGGREQRYPPSSSIDSYVPATSSRAQRPRSRSPGGYRARSRTPPRAMADSYRGRPVSPSRRYEPPRADSYPSRDVRPRSPRREQAGPRHDDIPRPRGERSPQSLKRMREPSPASEQPRAKSPPRRRSPVRDSRMSYRPRSRSPRRDDRLDPYAARFRPRSPSPKGDSGKNSSATSRRSSPRPQFRRAADVAAGDDARNAPNHRSPRTRSPPGQRESPASRTRTPYRDEANANPYSRDSVGMDARDSAPWSGHSGTYRDAQGPTPSVPTGPSSSSLGNSGLGRAGPPSAPGYSRGGYGGYRGRGGAPPAGRGAPSWGVAAAYNRAGTGSSMGGAAASGTTSPGGREAQSTLARRGSSYGGSPHPLRGSGNGSSTTTPRTQRFNQAMAGLPDIKPGGEKLPPLHDTSKADRLEEEAARLRKLIDDKEMKKRQGLKEWDRLDRESANAALRSELAEEHLRSLNGDGEGMAAAF